MRRTWPRASRVWRRRSQETTWKRSSGCWVLPCTPSVWMPARCLRRAPMATPPTSGWARTRGGCSAEACGSRERLLRRAL
eukprot:778123-Alexandrium_andersonii.AAC.1